LAEPEILLVSAAEVKVAGAITVGFFVGDGATITGFVSDFFGSLPINFNLAFFSS